MKFAYLFLFLCMFSGLALAECDEPYSLWSGMEEPDFVAPPLISSPEQIEITVITDQLKDLDYGHNVFLHGLSIAEYNDALVVTYAINPNGENIHGERCWALWSYDDGATWENFYCFESINDSLPHTSHGSLLVDNGVLYAFVPCTNFSGQATTAVWRYVDEDNTWQYFSKIGQFFPSSPVVKMADGNFIVGGGTGGPKVAITQDGDLSAWKTVRIPYATFGFGEVGIIAQEDIVEVLIRPEKFTVKDPFGIAETRGTIMTSRSFDYGKTFEKAQQSTIYSSKSEICGGVLSDGRPYAIFNMSIEYPSAYKPARMRFLLAVGEPGETTFNRLYTLLEAENPISYPYAIEKDGCLYIAYSELIPIAMHTKSPDVIPNSNNAMLMKVPIDCIP